MPEPPKNKSNTQKATLYCPYLLGIIINKQVDGLVQDCSNSSANALELLQSCSLYFEGLVQDCSNSNANALELLQSCTKPSKYADIFWLKFQ